MSLLGKNWKGESTIVQAKDVVACPSDALEKLTFAKGKSRNDTQVTSSAASSDKKFDYLLEF